MLKMLILHKICKGHLDADRMEIQRFELFSANYLKTLTIFFLLSMYFFFYLLLNFFLFLVSAYILVGFSLSFWLTFHNSQNTFTQSTRQYSIPFQKKFIHKKTKLIFFFFSFCSSSYFLLGDANN